MIHWMPEKQAGGIAMKRENITVLGRENKQNQEQRKEKRQVIQKKIIITMFFSMIVSLTACANTNGESVDQKNQNVTESTTTDQSENSDSNHQAADSGWNGESWSEEMEMVKKAVINALGERYWPDTQVTSEMLEGNFGISSDLYEDYLAEVPMISSNVDTLIVIKAKQDKIEEVTKALEAYRDRMVNDTMQYPMNLGKIQASQVEVINNYICFIQLGGETDDSEEVAISQCKEQNQAALEAIHQVVES